MKAILIIDVDDNTDFSKAKANITMQEDEYGVLLGNVGKKMIIITYANWDERLGDTK